MMIDLQSDAGKQLAYRLRLEDVIWLIVQREEEAPYPTPVWFVWEEEHDAIVIYSRADAKKIQHIRQFPKVSLHFNSSYRGDDITILTGSASIDDDIPAVIDNADYIQKYGRQMRIILNRTSIDYSRDFSVGYRVRFSRVNAFN